MRRGLQASTAIVLALQAAGARAEIGNFDFSFNGFGTAGVVHSSDRQADFVSDGIQPAGAGFTHAWSVTPDSKLGAQVTATFREQVSAVVQVVSQYQADGTYAPRVEWANLKYQITPDATLRAGRIAIPTFLYSDSLNVGYALPFVRLPIEVFGQLPVTNSDGVDGSYRLHLGGATTTLQAFAGRFNSDISGGFYAAHFLRGLVATVENDALTVHLGYQSMRYGLATEGVTLATDARQSLLTLGVSYDPGRWFVSGEWVRVPDELFGRYYGGYLVGGYRFDAITAYVGYARVSRAAAGSVPSPPFIDQRTNLFGLRWDFARHFDAKLQLDRSVLHGGLNVFFPNQQPGFDPRSTLNLLSLTVDFVW